MTEFAKWKSSARLFFAERGAQISGKPTVEDLCYVSGRDPRLWSQPEMYQDLIYSIVTQTDATPQSSILEVGCAAGFVAKGVAPRVRHYMGVDIARPVLRIARQLQLPNAEFRSTDGGALPFSNASFDAAFCYDVFTNFPRFEAGASIITEMLRVVKAGGKVLIGSIPDATRKVEYEERVKEVSLDLDAKFGPLRPHPAAQTNAGLMRIIDQWFSKANPQIVCYYFRAEDFLALGRQMGCRVEILDIHGLNPYFGYRFNAVYTKNPT